MLGLGTLGPSSLTSFKIVGRQNTSSIETSSQSGRYFKSMKLAEEELTIKQMFKVLLPVCVIVEALLDTCARRKEIS